MQLLHEAQDFCGDQSRINKAHHRLHEVTPLDAGQVSEAFDQIDRLLRSCSASYARFMARLTQEDRDLFLIDPPPAPTCPLVICPTRANQESLSAASSLAPPKSLRNSYARKIEFAEPIQRDLGRPVHGEEYLASLNCQS
jgi:hypothetical protein